jgi:membrane protease subunit HflC
MRVFGLLFAAILAIVGMMSLFTVHETERAIILRLGKIRTDSENLPAIYQPGLHVKFPLVDSVQYLDTRVQNMSIDSSRILTEEKKDVLVDMFIMWRIVDLPKFYTSTGGNVFRAERLLREQAVDGLRAEFGQRTIREVVSGERQEVMDILKKDSNEGSGAFGIEVLDTRIKRIDFPQEVSEKVFARMRTERERIASEHRAKGTSIAEAMRAEAEAKVTVHVADADRQSREMRGDGDAEAAKIYALAYGKDPEFYRFTRSLDAYRETFHDNGDILVLKPEGKFFDYFLASGEKR